MATKKPTAKKTSAKAEKKPAAKTAKKAKKPAEKKIEVKPPIKAEKPSKKVSKGGLAKPMTKMVVDRIKLPKGGKVYVKPAKRPASKKTAKAKKA